MARHRHPQVRLGTGRLWVAGYLASIVLVVAFVVVAVPWLLRASESWPIGMGLLFVSAPLVGTATGFLQNETLRRSGAGGFLRHYLLDLIDLGRQVLTLLATLPIIAMRLLLVVGAIMIIALTAMLLLGALQHAFTLHIDGISDFSSADLGEAALWLAGVLAAMLIAWLAMLGLQRLAPVLVSAAAGAQAAIRERLS